MSGPFLGRTIQQVRDFSVDEQVYLYTKTRELKRALLERDQRVLNSLRFRGSDVAVYLLFLEDSTRTKESFRNAAKFHELRLNDFSAAGSSFKKKESITDTIRMLVGYAEQSVFVLRTKHEGTCRWLERSIGDYTRTHGMPPAAFVNGGDGRHEHPTQEFLDEFSFVEQLGWNREQIHLALVGDLYHGRTVHSKVDGLGIFDDVRVDLIAPSDIAMPDHYRTRMKERGYEVREFESIDEYVATGTMAPIWYFTRLQLERMGDRLLDRADRLRHSVTFRRDHLSRIQTGTKFYHPLPRHQVTPTIPPFLDTTPLNAWEEQSVNGYLTRVIELGMLAGGIGEDFEGEHSVRPEYPDDFVHEVPALSSDKPDYKIGIKPVEDGLVIDHVGRGGTPAEIWEQINKVRRILNLNVVSSHGVYPSYGTGGHKGIISLPGKSELSEPEIKTLGASAPGCTLNAIRSGRVIRKYRMGMPPRVYDLPGISCKNPDCISHPQHHEPVVPEFIRSGDDRYACLYCERIHQLGEIW